MVERNGRTFVLYAGLLDEAHRQGLKSITTQLIQVPGPDNGYTAICQAVVETSKGVFSGIGDASPENVPPQMRMHLIRMAETRAKARALRDAVNVGVAALEELAEEAEAVEAGPAGRRAGRGAPRQLLPEESGAGGPAATEAQMRAIRAIGRTRHQFSDDQLEELARERFGKGLAELSRREASALIDDLRSGPTAAAS
jgi:hypothetical protein